MLPRMFIVTGMMLTVLLGVLTVMRATQSLATEKGVLRALRRFGPDFFFQLVQLKRADALAHAPGPSRDERVSRAAALEALGKALLARQACFSLKDLAVSGKDLLSVGFSPGPAVGQALNTLLDAVTDGAVPNEKAALLAYLAGQKAE